ncbi:hypothetical protein B296_00039028 [Ensete ventricosum]|uniref:Uncharacterized protein n=1 Tax=Ensete ventricosum TaxID=4639 RepID=A0A426XL57_ENSVE|nr:hypothetical protein B296_00039028 [Ensete ventricosum]
MPPYLSKEEFILVGRLKEILSSSHVIKEMIELWLVKIGWISASCTGCPRCLAAKPLDSCCRANPRGQRSSSKGESRSRSKSKEPAAPSEELETPAESNEGGASLVHHCPRSMKDLFKTKVHKDDVGYYTLHMSDLGHQDPDKEMKARWRGLKNSTKIWNDSSARLEASEKELTEVRSNLVEIQRLLKEVRVRARKMDDELLQSVKALESARAELPKQTIDRYNESVDFKEGLKRMGRVTYKYGYRVALARFHALHSDSKVEEDPFTIHPEDNLVPMKRQQVFDDSDPPES